MGLTTGNDYAEVVIEMKTNGLLSVSYKGVLVVEDLPIRLLSMAGRFGFGARTGAANETHWLDDLEIRPPNAQGAFELAEETLWIEPVNLFDPETPPDAHVVYEGRDVLPSPDTHDPVVGPDDEPADAASFTPAERSANKIVRLRVYEHRVSSRRTRSRCNIVHAWAAQVKREFRNIRPRQTHLPPSGRGFPGGLAAV